MMVRVKEYVGPQKFPLALLLGGSLHHTALIGGINSSLADVALMFVMVVVVARGNVILPRWAVLVFFGIASVGVFVAMTVPPIFFGVTPDLMLIVTGLIKFLTLSLFWFVGWYSVDLGMFPSIVRGYVLAGVVIGLIGITVSFVPIPIISDQMLFGGFRLRGFMADPNYFAILQVTALALVRLLRLKLRYSFFSYSVLVTSILLSGSKTGLLVMLAVLMIMGTGFFDQHKPAYRGRALARTVVLLVIGFAVLLTGRSNELISWADSHSPALARGLTVLVDFDLAVDAGGSNRQNVWQGGLEIINTAPLTGVGFGMYLPTVTATTETIGVAHNTYIQMAAEYGIVITLGWVLMLCIAFYRNPILDALKFELSGLRIALVAFLLAAGGLSLNNARVFWILLGACFGLMQFGGMSGTSSSREKVT